MFAAEKVFFILSKEIIENYGCFYEEAEYWNCVRKYS